jgi:hypothetical protein
MSTSDCSDQSGNEISEVSSTPGPQDESDEFSRYTTFIPEDREEGFEDEDESNPI